MNFPVVFEIGSLHLHVHVVFEVLAYSIGMAIYRLTRKRLMPKLSFDQNLWIFVGALIGAAVFSKVLGTLEWLPDNLDRWNQPLMWMENKTIVGGLLGGWVGVEVAKRVLKIRQSTGDSVTLAFIVGLAIGRVGCFLTGVEDKTVGIHTDVPWAVNFGDGPRHPSPLYEIGFLIVLGAVLFALRKRLHPSGTQFKLMVIAYLAFRLIGDFWKPIIAYPWGLSAIQTASLIGIIATIYAYCRARKQPEATDGRSPVPIS